MSEWLSNHEFFSTLLNVFLFFIGGIFVLALAGMNRQYPKTIERKTKPSMNNVGNTGVWMEGEKYFYYNSEGKKVEAKVKSWDELLKEAGLE